LYKRDLLEEGDNLLLFRSPRGFILFNFTLLSHFLQRFRDSSILGDRVLRDVAAVEVLEYLETPCQFVDNVDGVVLIDVDAGWGVETSEHIRLVGVFAYG